MALNPANRGRDGNRKPTPSSVLVDAQQNHARLLAAHTEVGQKISDSGIQRMHWESAQTRLQAAGQSLVDAHTAIKADRNHDANSALNDVANHHNAVTNYLHSDEIHSYLPDWYMKPQLRVAEGPQAVIDPNTNVPSKSEAKQVWKDTQAMKRKAKKKPNK